MELICGNSLEVLKTYPENFFDSCVTDPPYGLVSIVKRFGKDTSAECKYSTDGRFQRLSKGFMGNKWDGSGIEKSVEFWKEVYRTLKPGAHLLAFGGTRTMHRITCAIEDAGFEIRDSIYWIYGQGFPKSHTVGDGIGTALKPAVEPIVLARKPISEKTVELNVLKWGTGGINIDDSRIEINGEIVPINKLESWSGFGQEIRPEYKQEINTKGRWPANVILDEEAGKLLDEQTGITKSLGGGGKKSTLWTESTDENKKKDYGEFVGYKDIGGASRFFYCAKANKKEKNGSTHPTVKPIKLMEYLVKLITPKNGRVLDPFMGSGTTGIACKNLEYNFTGIELGEDYFKDAERRIKDA